MAVVDYGRDALDFIEGLNALHCVADVVGAMQRAFSQFGFETIIVTGLPNPEQKFSHMVLAKSWPTEFFKLYTERQFDRFDPVVRHCRKSVNAFEWSEAPYDVEREPLCAEVMRRAADFRMSRGFIAPIHGLFGYEAAVSLGGADLDLNPRSKPAIHLMAMYSFERVRQMMQVQTAKPKLSPREREVIIWAAQGKTAWETSEILHIAQRTVEEHLTSGARKLNATNRTHAVAIAIRSGLVGP